MLVSMTEMGTVYSESRIQASSIAQEGSSEGLIVLRVLMKCLKKNG